MMKVNTIVHRISFLQGFKHSNLTQKRFGYRFTIVLIAFLTLFEETNGFQNILQHTKKLLGTSCRNNLHDGILLSPTSSRSSKSVVQTYDKLCMSKFDDEIFDVVETEMVDSFTKSNFASTKCWGTKPLLMRGAFRSVSSEFAKIVKEEDDDDDTDHEHPWPTWEEVMNTSLEDDVEARFITHIPGDASSWRMTLGPFEEFELNQLHQKSSADDDVKSLSEDEYYDETLVWENEKWTMVVNDVDRFHPQLFDFISELYSFLPNWRIDDGQISLSNVGGGIGPHTDDYDVFLIQMAGTRKWDIGKRFISTKEELEGLHDELDVRILKFWDEEALDGLVESFTLEPGDVMYLPPRVAHCGTALSDGCMTLSVGLRAPSVKEMMLKLTEHVENTVDGDFIRRYTDKDLFNDELSSNNDALNEISSDVKSRAKSLLNDALTNLMADDAFFDEFFGKIATETKRARTNYPPSLDEMEEEDLESLGPLGDANTCIQSFFEGDAMLFSAEGITWSYSIPKQHEGNHDYHFVCRLFVDGQMFEVDLSAYGSSERWILIDFIRTIVSQNQLEREMFMKNEMTLPREIELLLCDLVTQGYLYGSDKNEIY